jgi:hypothetical protein
VILVGHSWAGAVITQAGADPKVKALVYINAFAPDAGQPVNDLGKGAAPLPWQKTIIAGKDGFIWIPPDSIAANFAQDLPRSQAMIIAATEGPTASRAFDEKLTIAAWHDKPSWYIVSRKDRMIAPDAGRAMARAIKARVTEVDSSHVVMLSHPGRGLHAGVRRRLFQRRDRRRRELRYCTLWGESIAHHGKRRSETAPGELGAVAPFIKGLLARRRHIKCSTRASSRRIDVSIISAVQCGESARSLSAKFLFSN